MEGLAEQYSHLHPDATRKARLNSILICILTFASPCSACGSLSPGLDEALQAMTGRMDRE